MTGSNFIEQHSETLWFEITKMLIAAYKNKLTVSFSTIFGTLSFATEYPIYTPVRDMARFTFTSQVMAAKGVATDRCQKLQTHDGGHFGSILATSSEALWDCHVFDEFSPVHSIFLLHLCP